MIVNSLPNHGPGAVLASPPFMPGLPGSIGTTVYPTGLSRRRDLPCRRSAELAGRPVRLSPAVPAGFDAPLDAHHRIIGHWVARQTPADRLLTRPEARSHIEWEFQRAVLDILGGNTLADLRVMVLAGDGKGQPPAIAIICDSVGQIDLGWIEKTSVLSSTLNGFVAPVSWRAAAYRELHQLAAVLPIFGFDEMMEELSGYYWDGETEDEGARQVMVKYHGCDPEDLILPSQVRAMRPDFMLVENAGPMKDLPRALQAALRRIGKAADAVRAQPDPGKTWYFDFNLIVDYLPEYEDTASLPALTLVPFDQFAQQLDQITHVGMETGFHNIAGFCELTDPDVLDRWFASLRLGAELIGAVQDLIDLDVAKVRP